MQRETILAFTTLGDTGGVPAYSHYYSNEFNFNAKMLSLGIFAVTWETVLGAIAFGGSAAISAAQVISNFSDANDDIADAYGYVSHF
jgi:hypothetical protein